MKVPGRQTISDKDDSGLLSEVIALKKGEVSAHLPIDSGLPGKLSKALNDVIELTERRAQLARLLQAAGKRGNKPRALLDEVPGCRKAVDREQLPSDLRGWLQR